MTATPSTFTPSTQILEAGEKAQVLVDAGNALKPLLPEEAKETLEGAEKIANALTATGRAMQHFGFDEADEDELVGAPASDIVKGIGVGITTTGAGISAYSAASTPVTTIFGVAGTAVGGGVAVVGGVTAFTGFVLGWCGLDVDESETYEQQNGQVDAVTGYALNNDDAAGFDRFQMHHDDGIIDGYLDTAEGEFSSNPQTLSPLNLDSALVTDAYQQQNAPGADLIAGEANQGMDPYQAQGGRYEVLA